MRVISPKLVARARDERGVVAVVVAICAVVLFGMAAFALDTGNLWTSRRHLVTATDGAALGAAQDYAVGTNGCATTAPSLLTQNYTGASLTGCVFSRTGPGAGYVTVTGGHAVSFTFAEIFGLSGSTVHSTTTAAFGLPLIATGLRPIGLCVNAPGVKTYWQNGAGNPVLAVVPYTNTQPDNCTGSGGSVPGNWGFVDLDKTITNNSNALTISWIQTGCQMNSLGAPCEVAGGDMLAGNPGAISGSQASALGSLVTNQTQFQVPLFDTVSGNGANARMHIIGFANVQLVGFQVTGPEASRYLILKFSPGVLHGTCCKTGGTDFGTRAVFICAVDANFDPSHCTTGP
jgi:Flp pilus assembly protein TadG